MQNDSYCRFHFSLISAEEFVVEGLPVESKNGTSEPRLLYVSTNKEFTDKLNELGYPSLSESVIGGNLNIYLGRSSRFNVRSNRSNTGRRGSEWSGCCMLDSVCQ